MLRNMTLFFDRIGQRFLPDPFLFAVLLTFVVFLLGIILTPSTPYEMVQHWGHGFWNLLEFSMQMVLILVTGYVLASSPGCKSLLTALARTVKTPGQAIMLVTFISGLASLINWGFGLVIGALFAKQLARVMTNVDYRLLIASAYIGFVLWHGGLSGSVPLTIATEGHFTQDIMGIIPTSETIFSTFNLVIVLSLLIILPLFTRLMMNYTDKTVTIDPLLLEDTSAARVYTEKVQIPAERLENSTIVSLAIGVFGLLFIFYHFSTNGFTLDLNIVNFSFLFLGIILHQTPRRFLDSVLDAVKVAGGIIIQFPFYAGIMGMMVASGLAVHMSNWFITISNDFTFPLFTFLSAGLVNFFIPSGGGQWAIQAPVVLPAGTELGVLNAKTAMAVAWGDAWTNLIQPFWALPALGIAGLRAQDIMGFCMMALLVSGVIISLGLLFF